MVVSVEQLWKAESPMAMRLRGSLMVVIEWQTAKAQSPIVVRLSGSVMEARCAHKKRLRRHPLWISDMALRVAQKAATPRS